MKILQLIDTLEPGGAERMAVNIANTLSEHHIENILVVTHRNGPMSAGLNSNTALHVLNKKHALDVVAFYRLIKVVANNEVTHIHAHSTSLFWAVLLKIIRPKLTILWHDHYGNRAQDKLYNIFLKIAVHFLSYIIVVNQKLYDWCVSHLSLKNKRIAYINNYPLAPNNKQNIIRKMNCEFNIVCLANIRTEKDHLTLIKALKLIIRQHPNIRTHLYLAGNYKHDDYYLSVTSLINSENLTDKVHILGHVDDTYKLLSTCHVGVLSSRFEGLPMSLLEYGIAEIPVIVTDVGECAEVVGHGKYGYIVPPGSPEALYHALEHVFTHYDEALAKAAQLKEHVQNNYGSKNFMKQYLQLLQVV